MSNNADFNLTNSVKPKKAKLGFLRGVFIPFIAAVLGAFIGLYLVIYFAGINPTFKNFMGLNDLGTGTSLTKEDIENIGDKPLINLEEFNNTSVGVAKKVLPSIVNIEVEYEVNTVFNAVGKTQGSGSGIILSTDGYILTNNHVVSPGSQSRFYTVSEASKIKVTFSNDDTVEAEIVGTDKTTDLAVIKVDKKGLTSATLGDSDDVQIGEFVMAVGSPLGFKSSVTDGIVSAVNRNVVLNDGTSFNSIQTNASINSGNSGGALVNSKGEVIGINTLKLAGEGIEGIGFAIPINDTKEISKALIENKTIERPTLGFTGMAVTEEMEKQYMLPKGILVREVAENSTAQKAGLKPRDIVIEFNGKKTETFNDIEKAKTGLKVGDEVKFKVFRNDEEIELTGRLLPLKEENQETENKAENANQKDERTPEQKARDDFFDSFLP